MNEELFGIQIKCLHQVGLHRFSKIQRPKLFAAFRIAVALTIASSGVAEFYFIMKNYKDVLASADAFSTTTTVIITLSKFFTFVAYRNEFYELMDRIKEFYWKNRSERLIKVNWIMRNLTILYFISALIVGVVQNCIPLVSDFVYFLQGKEVLREMPWKVAYPYDAKITPAYEATYISLVIATFFIIFVLVNNF